MSQPTGREFRQITASPADIVSGAGRTLVWAAAGIGIAVRPRHTLEASAVASGIPADMVDKAAGIAAVVGGWTASPQ